MVVVVAVEALVVVVAVEALVVVVAAITLVVVAVVWEVVPWLCLTVAWAPVGARK